MGFEGTIQDQQAIHEGADIEEFEKDAMDADKSGEIEKALKGYYNILGYFIEMENHEKIIETLIEISKLYKHKGKDNKALQHLYRALDMVNQHAPASLKKGIVYYEIARVYHDLGKLEKAIEYWKYSIPIFQSFDRFFEVSMAERYIGYSLRDIDQNKEALTHLQKALPFFKQLENPLYAANCSNAIGAVYQLQGDFDLAIDYFSEALNFYSKSSNPYDQLTTLLSMSICLDKQGEDDKAIATYLRALFLIIQNPSMTHDFDVSKLPEDFLDNDRLNQIISRRRKDAEAKIEEATERDKIVKLKLDYTSLLKIDGDFDRAIEIYNRLHERYHDQINTRDEARIHHNLGILYFEKEAYEDSLDQFREARDLYLAEKQHNDAFYSIIGMSDVYLSLGEPDKALNTISECLELFSEDSGALLKSIVFNGLGEIYQKKGIMEKSLEIYLKSLDLVERTSNPLYEAITLYHLGDVNFLLEDYEEAEDKYQRALKKFELILPTTEKAKTLTGLGNIAMLHGDESEAFAYYCQALSIYSDDDIDLTYTLNNLTDLYIKRKDYKNAIDNAMWSLTILQDNPNPFLQAIPLKKLAKVFYAEGRHHKAYEFAAQAATIWERSPNPNDIKDPLDLIYRYEPTKALKLGLKSPLGCNWILTMYEQKINEGNYDDPEMWRYFKLAVSNFWAEAEQMQHLGRMQSSYFMKNWKLRHYLEESTRRISPETTINYLFGANDLDDDPGKLRDTQADLDPMWFIEVPSFVNHGQEFLKFRLNNLVRSLGNYVSIPRIDPDGKDHYHNPAIKRLKFKAETQWLQKFEIDHLFYPNDNTEFRKYSQSPDTTWLSDIVVMELGSHTKSVDKVELTFTVEVFFDADSEQPDLISTTSTRSIPVVRKRNFQKVEKIKERHNNFLAVLLATWSIIISIAGVVYETGFGSIRDIITTNLPIIALSGLILLILSVIGGLWLVKPTDSKDRTIGFSEFGTELGGIEFKLDEIQD